MIRIFSRLLAFLASAYLLLPDLILAAGEKADMLVVVADSRRVTLECIEVLCRCVQHQPFHVRRLLRHPDCSSGGRAGFYNGFHYETHRNRPDFQKNS